MPALNRESKPATGTKWYGNHMKELRLFIALTLPDTVLESLESLQTGLPDVVRKELNQLADRIEGVRASAE